MDGATRTLAYAYDPAGNRNRITHPDGTRFETDYDALGRPSALWLNETTAMAGLWYYPHGAPSGRSPANGAYSQWGYDAVQRVSWAQHEAAGTAADLFLYFGYNPASQIASRTQSNDAYAWTGAYTVQRPYATNGLNQYSQTGNGTGTATFGYDANGNLTTQTVQNVTQTYVYDIENRLVAASGPRTAGLRYDPLGRLYEVTGSSGTTRFLYDGDALVDEYSAAGTLLRRYVHWGAGADVPYLWYEGATLASPHYLSADQQGSIILVSDAAGNPVINAYDEYGIPAAANAGRFQYTGQIWLAELGMYYYKARIYSPTLGRFLQTDPIGYEDQVNLYAYVGNDPVNMTDPTGTCSESCGMFNTDRHAAQLTWNAEHGLNANGVPWVSGREVLSMIIEVGTFFIPGGPAIKGMVYGWRAFRATRTIGRIESALARGHRLVLWTGRVPAIRRGEVAIDVSVGWTAGRNRQILAEAISRRNPIRETHVSPTGVRLDGGPILAQERAQLRQAGWNYIQSRREWVPGLPPTGSHIAR